MSARVVVGVVAGVAALGGGAVLAWKRWGSGAAADDVEGAAVPHGDGKAADVVLPVRVSSHADFVAQMRNAMSLNLPMLNRNGRQLMVAHGAYESGFGTGKAFRRGWNFGNLTAGAAWAKAHPESVWVDRGGDTDASDPQHVKTIDQTWRSYDGLGEAVLDYWAFLGGSRYLAARNVLEHSNGLDSDPFASNLRQGGYFTLQLAAYQRGLAATLAEVARGWGA